VVRFADNEIRFLAEEAHKILELFRSRGEKSHGEGKKSLSRWIWLYFRLFAIDRKSKKSTD